jgi:hypothetical protein
LLIPEGKRGKAWGPSNKQCRFRIRGRTGGKAFSLFFLIFKELKEWANREQKFVVRKSGIKVDLEEI